MANIQPITVDDTQARTKLNATITEANKVDGLASDIAALQSGKADTTALDAEAQARAQAITDEEQARTLGDEVSAQAIANEAQARAEGDAASGQALAAALLTVPTFAEAAADHSRPGDAPNAFRTTLTGTGEPPFVGPSPYGPVARIIGAGRVAPVTGIAFEPGRDYRVRFVIRRAADTDDPASDAIRLGVQWLKADGLPLGSPVTLVDLLNVYVVNGRQEYVFQLSTVAGDGIDAAPPAGAVFGRPFVQTFGGGETHVEVIAVTDLADAADWSPDVADLKRQIAGQQHLIDELLTRVESLEAAS